MLQSGNMVWNGGLMYNENTESGEVVSNWLMGEMRVSLI